MTIDDHQNQSQSQSQSHLDPPSTSNSNNLEEPESQYQQPSRRFSPTSFSQHQLNLPEAGEEQSPRSVSSAQFTTTRHGSPSFPLPSNGNSGTLSPEETGEYSPTSPVRATMATPPSPSSASFSGGGGNDSASGSGSGTGSGSNELSPTLGIALGGQRPSLGTTPSSVPLLSTSDIPLESPTSSTGFGEHQDPHEVGNSNNNHLPTERAPPVPRTSSPAAPRSSYSNGRVGSATATAFSSSSPSGAPKIRINDMPNSPQSVDTDRFPDTHSQPPFSSPFSAPRQDRGSVPSLPPVSPTTAMRPVHGSISSIGGGAVPTYTTSTHVPRSASGNILATAVDMNAASTTKGNIAARRALRMKQALSTDSKSHRYSRDNKQAALNRKPFQSTRLKGEIYKPWLEKRDPALRWARWITIGSIIMGFAIAAVICWDGYRSVPSLGKVCSVLEDDFSSGSISPDRWQHEVRLDGYGPGSFMWTTTAPENSYVKDNTLYIVPTLTSDVIGADAVTSGYTLNLTADGTCTSNNVTQCVAVSNSSLLTVINPVRSARLITKNTASIKYGKVEVRAKFPTGDWLWPRISLLPKDNVYGVWPRSGQIDILNGRGNNASYTARGVDYAQSNLHWGPTYILDRLYMTWGYREQRRTYYSQKYHTYGLEWNDKFLWTYIDSRVAQVISYRFNKESFWTRGKFPSTYTNGSEVVKTTNPWIASQNNVAPFDQEFYLAIDLAVGSMDGWFPDGEGGKPWTDDSASAMSDFWLAKNKWWDASWSKDDTVRGFAIDSVKMWKVC
ncbi:hypothetical protein CI109_103073 [Kwoniella shandongensis]|uniref:Uncharacterized protein n=1 Tax=Kwoniella shandongensis TaxID=1734106 RepID=A0A5M6C8T2_9TREE|nr:uncharacterized protein CI109_000264 [Kwoniella shandongensis]KAA5531423.1 hypothetical protein CI109_000264 [Kwoniella shandongensis]